MNTLESIEKRWGCRKYTEQDIDREILGSILNSGRLAPSAGNLQDRSFIVIRNKEMKAEIAKASGNQSWMQTAPVMVVIVAENKKNGKFFGPKGEKVYSIQDTSFAAQNMLLAATDLGLGSSLVVGFNDEKLNELLGISEPSQAVAIIVLGHPSESPKQSSKYPLEKFVFFEKYGEKTDNIDSTFGDFSKTRDKISAKAEETKKSAFNLVSWIKSLFTKKSKVPLGEDHFMEERKPTMSEMKMEAKDEIPRQLPRKTNF